MPVAAFLDLSLNYFIFYFTTLFIRNNQTLYSFANISAVYYFQHIFDYHLSYVGLQVHTALNICFVMVT